MCAATAGLGGILLGSFFYGEYSTNTADPGQLVLYAIAAAVIGGVSLFGGRGKAIHPLIGGIVIGAVYNGLGLLGISTAGTDISFALVLLAAVTVDSVVRNRGSGSIRWFGH